jgi:hypothetical protein
MKQAKATSEQEKAAGKRASRQMPIFIQKTYQEGNADFINAGKKRLRYIYIYIYIHIYTYRYMCTDTGQDTTNRQKHSDDSTYRTTNEVSKIQ